MKILVLGGTQFFGKRIVQRLLGEGHEVAIFSRGRSRPDFWPDIEALTGDRRNRHDLERRLGGRRFDAVIDNIAYDRRDAEALLDVLEDGAGHYLLCSSGAVYGDPSGWEGFRPVVVPRSTPMAILRHAYAGDVAEAFVGAVDSQASWGKTYNLAGEEIVSLDDYVRAVAEVVGRDSRLVSAPLERIRERPSLAGYAPPFAGERFIMEPAAPSRTWAASPRPSAAGCRRRSTRSSTLTRGRTRRTTAGGRPRSRRRRRWAQPSLRARFGGSIIGAIWG